MNFKSAPDDPKTNTFHRLVSENGLVHIGVFPVMFGFRVRCGFCDDPNTVKLDWCGGVNWDDVKRLYSLALSILKSRDEDRSCFDGLPLASKLKPFHRDKDFTAKVLKLAGPNFEMVELEKPQPKV